MDAHRSLVTQSASIYFSLFMNGRSSNQYRSTTTTKMAWRLATSLSIKCVISSSKQSSLSVSSFHMCVVQLYIPCKCMWWIACLRMLAVQYVCTISMNSFQSHPAKYIYICPPRQDHEMNEWCYHLSPPSPPSFNNPQKGSLLVHKMSEFMRHDRCCCWSSIMQKCIVYRGGHSHTHH